MRRTSYLLAVASLLGCAVESTEPDVELGITRQAISACNETVPANRFIDGIPAYAQCDATTNSAIFSNNGVDTAITQMGPDWVRTQYSGGYQCTELAHRYLLFKWDITWLPRGNAGQWCDTQPPANSGVVQTTSPVHGDLMVLAPGSCGAAQGTGHVVVVDSVDPASGRLSVVEQNRANRGSYMPSCGKCFLHVVANDGNGGSAGRPATAGSAAPLPAGRGAAGMGGSGMPMTTPMTTAPMTTPMTTAPMTTPMTTAPMTTPMTTAAPMAGAGGSPSLTGIQIPISGPASQDTGCSVARIGGPGPASAAHAALFAFALTTLCTRRSRRRNR